jgi:gluconolactonase
LIVFTDPPYGAPPDRPLDFQAVFAVRKDGSMAILADDFEKPNGLAFSPDEKTLYVCDTARYHVRAFDVQSDGSLAAGRVFATMDPGEPGGPDGMKVDRDGRVYVAVALGIWVYEPDGKLLGILTTPKRPANLAWRGPGGRILAITAVDQVHEIRLNVRGLLPVFGNTGS